MADPAERSVGTHNPRNDFIDQIAAQTEHDQQFGELTDDPKPNEAAESEAAPPEAAEPGGDPPSEAAPMREPGAEPAPPREPEPPPEPDDEFIALDQFKGKKVRLKIDGEDRVLTLEDALRDVQKKGAADRRLEEATRLANESKAAYERAMQVTQPPAQGAAEPQQPPLDPDVAAVVQAFRTGTDTEAFAAAQFWENRLAQKAIPTSDAVRAFVNDQVDFRSSAEWCKSEYQDLFADPVLSQMFGDRDAREVLEADAGKIPRRPYRERYKVIGDDLRTWVSQQAERFSKSQAQPTQTLEAKRDKKAAAQLPTAASMKDVAPAPADETEDNVQDVIANIAKARGQNMRSA